MELLKKTNRNGMPRDFGTRTELMRLLDLDASLLRQAQRRFPVRWPRYYLDLIEDDPQRDPIARMGKPTAAEFAPDPGDLSDPVADRRLRPIPFVVRKHTDRMIILTTKKCHFYCRFCFRREDPPTRSAEPGVGDWERIYAFLADHPEIEEPILSGGDPLTLTDKHLLEIGTRFNRIPSVKRWRIHSRAPVHYPARLSENLVRALTAGKPLTLVTHYNHPKELTHESRRIARLLEDAGITYKNQAVLLAGVNDRPEVQRELWAGLADLGILAYYLHHPDRAQGNAAFRLSLRRGLAIYSGLRQIYAGPLPRYVIDLPDGRGKVPVMDLVPETAGNYSYRHPDGSRSHFCDVD